MNPLPQVSVVLCTHNPRPVFLRRTLAALAAQTLPSEQWELILVDNASDSPIRPDILPDALRRTRIVLETTLGLTPARLRGIAEAVGSLIVFVDDDNLLDPDYLECALEIYSSHPWLGAWGGQAIGEFEIEPPAWAQPYLGCLAVRPVEADAWSNSTLHTYATPNGAGLCLRASVAQTWSRKLIADPIRSTLGRKGTALGSAEDTDLAWTACDLGLGCGLFKRLRLVHVIPRERFTLPYFERLLQGVAASHIILENIRRPISKRDISSPAQRLFRCYQLMRMPATERRLQNAIQRGRKSAYDLLGLP